MQKSGSNILYSASDIVNFLECEHLTFLDLKNLVTPQTPKEVKAEDKLIQDKGIAHEKTYLQKLIDSGLTVIDVAKDGGGNKDKAAATIRAMEEGIDIIYQATFLTNKFLGLADFLRKVSYPSKLGDYSYEVIDTKLAKTTKAKFIVQLAFYSDLLTEIQGVEPHYMHIVLGSHKEDSFRYLDYSKYFKQLQSRFLQYVDTPIQNIDSYQAPCAKCGQCKWIDLCTAKWVEDDHLYHVANITGTQINKLHDADITTLEALGTLSESISVPKIEDVSLKKLHHQARLQLKTRKTGERYVEILPQETGTLRGFARLPKPNEGDMFFDMEGDPLEEGGLEYLFGLFLFENGKYEFKTFWAHSRAEEKLAFEAFIDYITLRLVKYPEAHIYHYASYEETAMKKLMTLHGTREAEVDSILRNKKLVDLYKVVKEGIRISEPRYSIKNVEHFYREARSGDVQSAGASIVFYDEWKKTGNKDILKKIADYNFDDVESTYQLREWLLGLRPDNTPWFKESATLENTDTNPKSEKIQDLESRLMNYRLTLIDNSPENRDAWTDEHEYRELIFFLLDFYRRSDKPQWWAMFDRQDATYEALIEDGDALEGLTLDETTPITPINKSLLYTYNYPEQESKLHTGSKCVMVNTLEGVTIYEQDSAIRKIVLKRGAKYEPLPSKISIGLGGPIDNEVMRDGVFRFADSVINNNHRYKAVEDFLHRAYPRINGLKLGLPIIDECKELLPQVIDVVGRLNHSYLFLQGPPGAGKTHSASHIIVDLLKQGKSIGVTSNSHKAIINLLQAVEKVAKSESFKFRGGYKGSEDAESTNLSIINHPKDYKSVMEGNYQLIAGTAWLFSRPDFDQEFDYLFIDEAGQVSLANFVAMGISSRNIILMGDQMQLSQPIQGVHPCSSGDSILDYLLKGQATIPPERGIFLKTTYRMHSNITKFISNAFYDGRLESQTHTDNQKLVLNNEADSALMPVGIRFLDIDHDGCAQSSEVEAIRIAELYNNLLSQSYQDKDSKTHKISVDDILVVAPFNIQVKLLKEMLPVDARVGTIDKFQGQEAPVVIVSMTTSSGEYLPRNIDFLFSKNRLNVAISRAKCLAIIVANPKLMTIQCSTPLEMSLVNTLCWVKAYTAR